MHDVQVNPLGLHADPPPKAIKDLFSKRELYSIEKIILLCIVSRIYISQ